MALVVSCPICFDYFTRNDEIHSTSCGHVYHLKCLEKWKKQSPNCPQCRSDNPISYQVFLSFVEESKISKKSAKIKSDLELVKKNNSKMQSELDGKMRTITALKDEIKCYITKISLLELQAKELEEQLVSLNKVFKSTLMSKIRFEAELEMTKNDFVHMQNKYLCTVTDLINMKNVN